MARPCHPASPHQNKPLKKIVGIMHPHYLFRELSCKLLFNPRIQLGVLIKHHHHRAILLKGQVMLPGCTNLNRSSAEQCPGPLLFDTKSTMFGRLYEKDATTQGVLLQGDAPWGLFTCDHCAFYFLHLSWSASTINPTTINPTMCILSV